MRILCIDGDYFIPTFRKLGHDVLGIGVSGHIDVKVNETLSLKKLLDILNGQGFSPDVMLWADTCRLPMVTGIEALPWPTMAFSIDQYMNPWHQPFSAGFDVVFVAQRDYLDMFAHEYPRPAVWLPLFCNPAIVSEDAQHRDIPVSFVGTLDPPFNPARKPLLEEFKRMAPLVAVSGRFEPVYSRSRLVLNQSAAGELNFRIFEAMCCGATVLTEDVGNGMSDLFTPGVDVLLYPRGDAKRAAAIAQEALARLDLETVARAGQKKVLRAHSVTARAKTILSWAERLYSCKAHMTRMRDQDTLRRRMSNAYRILALDEKLPITQAHRHFFLEVAALNAD